LNESLDCVMYCIESNNYYVKSYLILKILGIGGVGLVDDSFLLLRVDEKVFVVSACVKSLCLSACIP
jgi:hypothetical protein